MDNLLLSRPPKPLATKTTMLFIRVDTSDVARLIEKWGAGNGEVSDKASFNLYSFEIDNKPTISAPDLQHLYVLRLACRGGAKGSSYNRLITSTSPKGLVLNDAEPIVAELRYLGIEFVATAAIFEMKGERTYVDGSALAGLMTYMPDRFTVGVATRLMDNPAPYLLITDTYKRNIAPKDRQFIVRTSNRHSFLMGEEEDIVRLKLKHGGTLVDMIKLRNPLATEGTSGLVA